ncbi:MAG: hypothetical protein KDA96_27910 [Planctomycetaceae bacterium]|nr:hypothetical protein [Planctomycetaceae bacterium]
MPVLVLPLVFPFSLTADNSGLILNVRLGKALGNYLVAGMMDEQDRMLRRMREEQEKAFKAQQEAEEKLRELQRERDNAGK